MYIAFVLSNSAQYDMSFVLTYFDLQLTFPQGQIIVKKQRSPGITCQFKREHLQHDI